MKEMDTFNFFNKSGIQMALNSHTLRNLLDLGLQLFQLSLNNCIIYTYALISGDKLQSALGELTG